MNAVGTLWRDAAQRDYVLVEHVTDERVYMRRVLVMPQVGAFGAEGADIPAQRGRALFTGAPGWTLSPITFDCAYVGGGVLQSAHLRLYTTQPALRWHASNVLSMRLRRNLELSAFRPALARERDTCGLVLYVPEAVLAESLTAGWRLHKPAFLVLYERVPRKAAQTLRKHVRALYRDQGWRRLVTLQRLETTLDGRLVAMLEDDELTHSLRTALPDYCTSATAYIEFSAVGTRRHYSTALPSFSVDGRNINLI